MYYDIFGSDRSSRNANLCMYVCLFVSSLSRAVNLHLSRSLKRPTSGGLCRRLGQSGTKLFLHFLGAPNVYLPKRIEKSTLEHFAWPYTYAFHLELYVKFLASETPTHEFIVPQWPQGTPNVHKV